jgi:glutathione peroxidase
MGKGEMMNKKFLVLGLLLFGNFAYADCSGLYSHEFETLQGKKINLCAYEKMPILVVNTASKCGFTPQFEQLESMYKKYQSKMLIIGFPSNDFRQELTTNQEVGDFCINTYKVQFPMVVKSSVRGPNANPLYRQLIEKTKQSPEWNFYKYLILPDGKNVYVYSSDVEPESKEMMKNLAPFLN